MSLWQSMKTFCGRREGGWGGGGGDSGEPDASGVRFLLTLWVVDERRERPKFDGLDCEEQCYGDKSVSAVLSTGPPSVQE